MREDQLLALEAWIVSIVRDEDRASDVHEALARSRAYEDVRQRFLEDQDGD
jgi:hypothetical protein